MPAPERVTLTRVRLKVLILILFIEMMRLRSDNYADAFWLVRVPLWRKALRGPYLR